MNKLIQKHQYLKFCCNPSGSAYSQLIELMFSLSDCFILAERLDVNKDNKLIDTLQALKKFELSTKYQRSWAGTKTLGFPAKIHYYKVCDETKEVLINTANSLYEWVQPLLPEDLSFISENRYIMITTSHEKSGGIVVPNSEVLEKAKLINNLKVESTYISMYNKVVQSLDCNL